MGIRKKVAIPGMKHHGSDEARSIAVCRCSRGGSENNFPCTGNSDRKDDHIHASNHVFAEFQKDLCVYAHAHTLTCTHCARVNNIVLQF